MRKWARQRAHFFFEALLPCAALEAADRRRRGDHSSGGRESSRVICTYFCRKGMLTAELWRADLIFTQQNLSAQTVHGYHLWAIPYVKLMRRSALAERIMYPVARWRAEELAFRMGMLESGNWKGELVRASLEPLCWLLGAIVGEKDWELLWNSRRL